MEQPGQESDQLPEEAPSDQVPEDMDRDEKDHKRKGAEDNPGVPDNPGQATGNRDAAG